MPGFNPDKINIHDLTVEEPQEIKGPFDAEKDLREWPEGRVNEELHNLAFQEQWSKYADMLYNARMVYPDGENLFMPDPRLFEHLSFDLNQYEIADENAKGVMGNNAIMLCLLGRRSQIADVLEKIEQEVYGAMSKKYDNVENTPDAATEAVANYKLLYPKFSLPPMEKIIKKIDSNIKQCKKEKDDSNLTMYLFQKKLFNGALPPEDNEIIPFDYMRNEMQNSETVVGFLNMAGQFACLSADKIAVDEEGVHLSFSPKVESEEPTPSMPELKNF